MYRAVDTIAHPVGEHYRHTSRACVLPGWTMLHDHELCIPERRSLIPGSTQKLQRCLGEPGHRPEDREMLLGTDAPRSG
jgi:hypothetical protein